MGHSRVNKILETWTLQEMIFKAIWTAMCSLYRLLAVKPP